MAQMHAGRSSVCRFAVLFVAGVAGSIAAGTVSAAPGADGFDWATIGAVGNAAYTGIGPASVRGRVNHQYKISKLEISTAQWLEFTNTFSTQTNQFHFTDLGPVFWGASFDPTYSGPGTRYRLRPGDPNAGMRPVAGIAWTDAARYCNWLHNGKSSSLSSLTTGAYDTTTFGGNGDTGYTGALTHLPGAKYWIPTLDEWLKATYYDPDRFGKGVGGWWEYTNRSNQEGVSGLPGVGTTSADLIVPNFGQYAIPLGAYSGSVSPWGLLDTSGGAREWTEELTELDGFRFVGGPGAGDSKFLEHIGAFTANAPEGVTLNGLRIASAIPNGSTLGVLAMVVFTVRRRR